MVESASSRVLTSTHLAQILRDRIRIGTYQVGEFLPSERDLAESLEVSRETIRRVIGELVSDGIVERERGRGNRIISIPGESAPSRTRLIGMVIYGLGHMGSASIFNGCHIILRNHGYHLIVCETSTDVMVRATDEAIQLRALMERGIDGMVLYAEPTAQNQSLLHEAMRNGIHIVQVDRYIPGLPSDYIGVENERAAYGAVERLIELGHRRIAHLTMEGGVTSVQERQDGYRRALISAGIEPDPELIASYSRADGPDQFDRILDRWLQLSPRPSAIFSINDTFAVEMLSRVKRRGFKVPDAVSISGFDDVPAAAIVTPPLTTVAQPFSLIGQTAAQVLLDRISGRLTGPPRHILLPTQLIVRESIGRWNEASVKSPVGSRMEDKSLV